MLSAASPDGAWDLITATDVLPYMGDIADFLTGCAARLSERGWLAFSSETLPDAAFGLAHFKVGSKQRFAHSAAYIQAQLREAGLQPVQSETIIVRYDEGAPIFGQLVIAAHA